jgi:hypothetical protein
VLLGDKSIKNLIRGKTTLRKAANKMVAAFKYPVSNSSVAIGQVVGSTLSESIVVLKTGGSI